MMPTAKGSPEDRLIESLKKSRLGRLSYGNEEPGKTTGLMARLNSSGKQNVTSPCSPSSTSPRMRPGRLSFPVSPGRTLYSPNDPKRPKELDRINLDFVVSPSHLDDAAVFGGSPEVVKEKPKETKKTGKVAPVLSPPVVRPERKEEEDDDDEAELLREFDAVLTIEDGLDEVARELKLYEERSQEAVRESVEARVKMIRAAYAKFARDAEDRLRVAQEKAAEERRLRNLEAEKMEQLWRMEMQRLHERMKQSTESKAEELRSKTRNFEEELSREENRLRARFDELIRLEKVTSEKIVDTVRKSGELATLVGSGGAGGVFEKVQAAVASARRCLDNIAAGMATNGGGTFSDQDLQLLSDEERSMTACLKVLDDAIGQADADRKIAEERGRASQQQQQQHEQKQRDEANKEKQQLRVSSNGLKEYAQLIEKVDKLEELAKTVTEDASLKGLRFQLQKAVNLPINAISNENSSNFREMTQRLIRLLGGHAVDAGGGKTVAASSHHLGVAFCVDRVAAVFIRQAEDQIASNPEAAFPMAAAIVSLWMELPEFGEIFLGKLFNKCPYLVPYYPSLPPEVLAGDEARQSYQRNAVEGRILVNDVWEDDAQFFKRIGGLARLFGAIVQTRIGPNNKHPCGPERGWRMIADIVKLPPKPGVTATVLAEFLATAGHRLSAVYGRQFTKLLLTLGGPFREGLGSGTPVVLLEEVIGSGLKRGGSIPAPKGVLTIVL